MTPKFHPLVVQDVRKETDDTVSIAFEIPSELTNDYQFVSGQYITIRKIIDGEELRRSYSICATPQDGELRVAVKRVEDGRFSSWATSDLKTGEVLDVMTPSGHFQVIPEISATKSYALFAAGSGITPIISIAKTILTNEPMSTVTLVYGNKGFSSIIFREELEALKNKYINRFQLIHVLSRESLGNPLQKGRIDKDKVALIGRTLLKGEHIDAVYSCGPEEMIHAVKNAMMESGVPENKIHFELFGTKTAGSAAKIVVPQDQDVLAKVTIILDGDRIEVNLNTAGTSILEAGYAAGADLPFACKGGVCCTCKAKILEGSAVMDVNYALEKDEVEAGYILTCQAHPTSEKLTVSFDD
ncbi:1,2-phenylacetyl-CoA epoxidase subunit PaaE [Fluviicola taffensis]|uniref:1,2-phenylacetyl-CoA epoxidase subunit PaaE n=1 Tax=Fluviicola taffensis TaxID=191579 RepID=UPI0031380B0F